MLSIANAPYDFSKPETLVFDLENPKPKDLLTMKEAFEESLKGGVSIGTLPVATGWNDIDPAKALDLLRRNRPGANRKVDPATVFYYGKQMQDGEWKATGQPILFDRDGTLVDAQHRLWAVVVSGVTIKTYVVTEIEPIPHLFAYIDNSKTRTAAAALQTSGLNGVSPTIVKVVKIAEEVRLGVYDPTGIDRLSRMTPAEMLNIAGNYPNALLASRAAYTDWAGAVNLVGKNKKDVVAYLGMRIADLHEFEMADDFYDALLDRDAELPTDNALVVLRKALKKENEKPTWKRHHLLAALTKAFNAWRKNEPLKGRWMLQVDEAFPDVDAPEEQREAAE